MRAIYHAVNTVPSGPDTLLQSMRGREGEGTGQATVRVGLVPTPGSRRPHAEQACLLHQRSKVTPTAGDASLSRFLVRSSPSPARRTRPRRPSISLTTPASMARELAQTATPTAASGAVTAANQQQGAATPQSADAADPAQDRVRLADKDVGIL